MQDMTGSAEQIWAVARKRLKDGNINLYEQWFQKLVPLSVNGSTLLLGVSDDFFGHFVRDYYNDLMLEALRDVAGVDYDYEFEPGHEPPPPEKPAVTVAESAEPAPARPKIRSEAHGYTFENFIVGEENRHAYRAARTAAEEPGLYNPLFIYGQSGVGKTHLLQAVANAVRAANPKLVVRSLTCNELLDDFYELLRQGRSLTEFRASVRNVDVLLVDDVHSLARKVQMQEEFFNLFNALYRKHKQIILTSDRQPCEISDIDKRLTTRFESGMISEIGMPEYEARLEILRMWRGEVLTQTPLSDEFLEFLAGNISSSVRRLRSSFLRLTTYASLSGNDLLSIEQAEELLHAQLEQESAARNISIEDIQRSVAGTCGITIADLLGEKRTRNVAEPRMIAMYLSRALTSYSSTEIGVAFGKNHATILHAEKKVPALCESSSETRRLVAQIKRQLQRS